MYAVTLVLDGNTDTPASNEPCVILTSHNDAEDSRVRALTGGLALVRLDNVRLLEGTASSEGSDCERLWT